VKPGLFINIREPKRRSCMSTSSSAAAPLEPAFCLLYPATLINASAALLRCSFPREIVFDV